MSKTKKVQVSKPFTFAGAEYGVMTHPEMPEDAAKYAERRKFGKVLGEKSAEAATEGFTPLPLAETLKRMNSLDLSDEVLDSIKVHRDEITEGIKSGKSLGEIAGMERFGSGDKTGIESGAQTGDEGAGKPEGEGGGQQSATGLPDDFPMKHVFENPNELSKNGFKSVAEIQAHTLEQLISINGIAERTAQKALAYGK